MSEKERMESVYRDYVAGGRYRRLWQGPGHEYLQEAKWRAVDTLLRETGFRREGASILDLGSEDGRHLQRFAALGVSTRAIVCVDLMHEALRDGRTRNPRVPFVQADALRLPFPDERFDLVHQSVMASSVLDPDRRFTIAREMVRVTRRGGLIVWYDLRSRNPFNPHVRPIGRRNLERFFQDCHGDIVSLTLIPHLARAIAPISQQACRLLERIPLLRSHLLAVLRRG